MRTFLKLIFFYVPAGVLLISLLVAAIVWQRDMIPKDDMDFLIELGKNEGLGAVVFVVKAELFGVDPGLTADASYGRELVAGRGHAPWVIRGNLDGRSRMLQFALAPELWAAYDTATANLYQVWEGDVLFEGAVYDYRHGPQPSSQGQWFIRQEQPAQWFMEFEGDWHPATVKYLGHEYGAAYATAAYRFELAAAGQTMTLLESPELQDQGDRRVLLRRFTTLEGEEGMRASFVTADGQRHLAESELVWPLLAKTPIDSQLSGDDHRRADADDLDIGQAVVANGDCLGCHNEVNRVVGPAWAEVSGRYRGKNQDTVISSLAKSVMDGGVGKWGTVPMPAHLSLSEADARAAISYILETEQPDVDQNPPLDSRGIPYAATRKYQTNPKLKSLHPSFTLENLAPPGFQPKVGGMDFRRDGKLLVASWDKDGAVFLLDLSAPPDRSVKRIAEGLHEPLGLAVVDDRLFVLQKQELTELIDTDGDEVIDRYRTHSYDWPSSSNFHSFAFGLIHKDDAFLFLLSICVLPGGASCPDQLPTQGKLLEVDMSGNAKVVASGFRTPNGINMGPGGDVYVTDNQGDWLPANKLVRVSSGGFYGSRAVAGEGVMEARELPPVVWLPQDEIGNSPTQPLVLTEGPYAGQIIHGDVYNGGIKRVYIEDVDGVMQGAAFHFSAGFQSSVNRLVRGPDGAIYVGEIGNPPNWGEYGKPWYGLERLSYLSNDAFEMRSVKAIENGFVIELTQPLAEAISPVAQDLLVKQWFYHPTAQYGGPKYDQQLLRVESLDLSADRRELRVTIPGLKAGYVVYLRLDDRFRSDSLQSLWTAEAWYTLNVIPGGASSTVVADEVSSWKNLFDGHTLKGWRNYGGSETQIEKWVVDDGMLTLAQDGLFPGWKLIYSSIFGGGSGDLIYYLESFKDFELSLEWKISESGNSGIFYLVKGEQENAPWETGIEMQVLDNEGHADGKINTHRAGDLYGLLAAKPETVRPPGQWNEVRIRVLNNHIEHWLNGVKVVDIERESGQWNDLVAKSKFSGMPGFGRSDSGYIVLQDHGDQVWYRHIRIRELFGE